MSNTKEKKCGGKTQAGKPCSYKVSKKCDDEYCEKHVNQWLLSIAQEEDPGAHLCESRRNCDPDKPKIKTILPSDYVKKSCKPCLDLVAELERNERQDIIAINNKAVTEKSDTRICPKCPKNDNKHHVNDMGGINNESQYCKKHYHHW